MRTLLNWLDRFSLRGLTILGFAALVILTLAAGTASLQSHGMATLWAVAVAGLVAILLGLGAVVLLISRNVNRSLRACVEFACNVAQGDLNTRMPPSGGNEFGVLIASLNRMADALQAGHQRDQERVLELGHLNRTLRVLSLCNEALVRAENESDLLQAICNQVVQTGGYCVAWVGFACHDEDKSVRPAACAGTACDYVNGLHLTWGDDMDRRGVGGAAIREGKPVVARDIATDPVFAPWRTAALERGFASCIALPLKNKNGVLGTLSIYAPRADAFDAEEVKLLVELADDLAYGIASLREIDERKRFERELAHRIHFDVLTGLANRATFETRLEQALAHARRQESKVAILFIDLDRFKSINESFDHAIGDRVLITVAQRLSSAVRESDTVARLGGDEFVIFLTNMETAAQGAAIAGKIAALISVPLQLEQHEVRPTASIGISLFPDDGENVGALMKGAEAAKHHAKSLGGITYRFYAAEMNRHVAARFDLETNLRRALERGELMMYYQPQVSLSSGELTGAEALIRWLHPDKGMISPAEFIPLAEETGLIQAIGDWVIDDVCAQLRTWLDAGLALPVVAVNLSARQFHQENLVQRVRQALERNHLEPTLLELEITESAVMHDVAAAVDTLQKLKALGVKLSLDDFGTGYSSLSYLKRFPVDHLKIDQSFVREVTTDPDDAAICVAVIGLAHNLGLTVIAEGVETEGQMQYLRRHDCDAMQGYYFSRPLPAQEFAQLLRDNKTLALPVTNDSLRTLLIVDDEANVVSALTRLLRRDGYHILGANSARQGLELLALHPVQVVLSDQRMPEMNGTEFLSKVKELYPDTLRIILSGYTQLESVIEAINRGAIYRFFTKPWDDNLLRDNVREVFRHHGLLHPAPEGEAAEKKSADTGP